MSNGKLKALFIFLSHMAVFLIGIVIGVVVLANADPTIELIVFAEALMFTMLFLNIVVILVLLEEYEDCEKY